MKISNLGLCIGARQGSLNKDQEAFGNIQNPSREPVRKTFCNSYNCTKNSYHKNGTLIHKGKIYLETCPVCGMKDYLVHV